jgi:hypothetical protein
LRANGDFLADSTNKANNIDQYTANISCVSTPVKPKGEIVRRCSLCGIQILDLKIPLSEVGELFVGDMIEGETKLSSQGTYLADNVIIADDDACNRREEDRVCRKVGGKVVGCRKEIPRTHRESNRRTNEATTSNVDVSRQKSCHVCTLQNVSFSFALPVKLLV